MDPVSSACDELFGLTRGRLLVAFSGGMDSTVLLHAVAEAARRREVLDRVLAVHVDHGLSPDSDRWAEHCRASAAALGVDFQAHSVALASGSSLESRARTARYQVFDALLERDDLLLLAHHAGDQTESLLLHLFQGRGLYGMPAARTFGAGRLLRPFLDLPRETLAGYARAHDLAWVEDPSNADVSLDRNFLRHSLLPLLTERFSQLPKRLSQVARSVADTGAALDELADLDRHPLPLEVLDGLSRSARIAVLRRWLSRQGINASVTRSALSEFLRQLEAGNDRQPRLDLPSGGLVRYRRALYFAPPAVELEQSYELSVPGSLSLPHGVLMIAPLEVGADSATGSDQSAWLLPPVTVTFLREFESPAEIFQAGHRRSVRTLMREAGIPPWLRDGLPLVCDRLGIACIAGVAGRDPTSEDADGSARSQPCSVRWTGEVH